MVQQSTLKVARQI